MRRVELGENVALSVVTWGGPVELETEPAHDWYLVTVPLGGKIDIRVCSGTVRGTPQRAVIIDPDDESWQHWSAEAEALWVQLPQPLVEIEAQHVERAAQGMISLPPRRRIRFRSGLDLTEAHGRDWFENLMRLIALVDEHGAVDPVPPHRLKAHKRQLITGLLGTQQLSK